MKYSLPALWWLAVAAALALPRGYAAAQMDFGLDEEEGAGDTGGGDDGTMTFGEDGEPVDSADTGDGDTGDTGSETGDGDVIGDLAATAEPVDNERDAAPRRTEAPEEIYAVQQIYALRLNRVELAPSGAFTINDPYVSHPSLSIALNYWWTNVLALGVSFLWYQWGRPENRESDLNFFVRRSTRLAIPITEWQLGAYLNFTYVPFYGKFAVFNKLIFQWDAYIVGGVGLMRTRPVPVVDPEFREFSFDNRVAFNLGLGIRVFVSRWLGVFLEFRDYAYLERFENLTVGVGSEARSVRENWIADSPTFTNNVTTQVGLTIFFPFSVEYNLPK